MSILIKGTNIEDLQHAMLMFSGHEIVDISDHGDLIEKDPLFKKAEELEKYYDSGKRCYVIQTKNYGIIEISPATIGVANAVMDWGIKQERAQKKWDNSLVSLIPFLV